MRTVRARHRAIRDDIGELHTWRALPNERLDQIDPFLFLNHHGPQIYPPHNRGLPFGPHPHRGFETVTFIVDGSLTHRDSGGHESTIEAGGVQSMTAGRGVQHAELSPPEFLERGGPLEILQLWVNLPSRLKMTEPRYIGLQKDEIPSFALDDDRVTFHHISAAIQSITGVTMTTIDFKQRGRITLDTPPDRNIFLYIVRGETNVGSAFHLIELNDDGEQIDIEATTDAIILFGHATPIGEPVVSYGPFVMNTREEIVQAIRDYEAGTFGGL